MGTLKSEYLKLETARYSYLTRGRDCSRLTLPHLLPDEGDQSATLFPTPYQSVGARGVNNLASALLLSLLPPNAPFFRFVIDPKASKNLAALSPQAKTEAETSLSEMERIVMRDIEGQTIRVSLFEALKQLLVVGNVLVHFPDDGGMRVFRLDNYVVKRCCLGKVKKIILKESLSVSSLSPELLPFVGDIPQYESNIDLYTCCHLCQKNKVEIYQEINGKLIPDSYATYPEEKSPFIALRMHRVDGEDYGRSYVEQYFGDLVSLDSLSKSIVESAAVMSKVVFLVNPVGTTRAKKIAQSLNGSIIEGNAADVTVLQAQKSGDLSVALQTMGAINERLSYAFMLTEASIRNAERVTAEEVRLVTQSIERQLGGIYSILSLEFQLPLVNRIVDRLTKEKKMPKMNKKFITPTIVTGIDALGRGNDLNRLDIFLGGIAQLVGPEALGNFLNLKEYLNRRAASLGIDTMGLIKTDEQLQQEAQMAQQQQLLQMAGPKAAETIGNMVQNQVSPQ